MSAKRARKARFPEGSSAPACIESDIAALRFSIALPDGGVVGVNLTDWPRPRLTRAFAKAFYDDMTSPGTHAGIALKASRPSGWRPARVQRAHVRTASPSGLAVGSCGGAQAQMGM